MKVLLFSDDLEYSRRWFSQLQSRFDCDRVTTLQGLFALASLPGPQLIVLMLKTGTDEALLALRQKFPDLPFGLIAFAPHYNLEFEQNCYASGVDYCFLMNTPFTAIETRLLNLERRITARHAAPASAILPQSQADAPRTTFPDFELSHDEKIIKYKGEVLQLPPVHHKLLVTFLTRVDQLLTRELLVTLVWSGQNISKRSVDAQISKLKKSLPTLQKSLVNLYGRGYVLKSSRDKQRAA